jgi:hypothetical protein
MNIKQNLVSRGISLALTPLTLNLNPADITTNRKLENTQVTRPKLNALHKNNFKLSQQAGRCDEIDNLFVEPEKIANLVNNAKFIAQGRYSNTKTFRTRENQPGVIKFMVKPDEEFDIQKSVSTKSISKTRFIPKTISYSIASISKPDCKIKVFVTNGLKFPKRPLGSSTAYKNPLLKQKVSIFFDPKSRRLEDFTEYYGKEVFKHRTSNIIK